ncbi:hypothetical protein OROGR_018740 [Orobanche gracilis]
MDHSGFGYHHHHHHRHPYLMSPNPSFFGFSIGTGHLCTRPVCEHPHFFEESTLRNAPMFPFSGLQQLNTDGPNHPQNRLYDMPNFHNAFHPVFDFGRKNSSSTMGPTHPAKKIIVFDKSCDKTTLIYSSWAHNPIQLGAYWLPNPPTTCNMTKEELRIISNPLHPSTDNGSIDYNSGDFTEDEMHEDTEEINALLFSDSVFSEDDDEETSTGHSPITMTDNAVRDSAGETGEEVDSFDGPATKRRKISDGCYKNVGPILENDDAEPMSGDNVRYDRRKRLSREKVHETLRALQSVIPSCVIPNAKGKDSVAVIEEAIDYLRSLKMKVKSFGLDAL